MTENRKPRRRRRWIIPLVAIGVGAWFVRSRRPAPDPWHPPLPDAAIEPIAPRHAAATPGAATLDVPASDHPRHSADTPSADALSADTPPADALSADAPSVVAALVDAPSVDAPSVDAASVETPSADAASASADTPSADTAPADTAAADTAAADTAAADTAAAETPPADTAQPGLPPTTPLAGPPTTEPDAATPAPPPVDTAAPKPAPKPAPKVSTAAVTAAPEVTKQATPPGVSTSGALTSGTPNALFTPTAPTPGQGAQPLPDGSAPGPEYTIKGNADSMLFHLPSSPYYKRTKAEVWFRTPEDATAAGFTEWTPKRRSTP